MPTPTHIETTISSSVGVSAGRRGLSSTVVRCEEAETLGINSRAELLAAERAFQARTAALILSLLALMVLLNLIAVILRRRFERRW